MSNVITDAEHALWTAADARGEFVRVARDHLNEFMADTDHKVPLDLVAARPRGAMVKVRVASLTELLMGRPPVKQWWNTK